MYRENDPIPRNNIGGKVSKGIQCCDIKHFYLLYPVLLQEKKYIYDFGSYDTN